MDNIIYLGNNKNERTKLMKETWGLVEQAYGLTFRGLENILSSMPDKKEDTNTTTKKRQASEKYVLNTVLVETLSGHSHSFNWAIRVDLGR